MSWQEKRAYEESVDRFRRLVGPLPYWSVEERDGHPVLVDTDNGQVLLLLDSVWNPTLRRFFETVNKDGLLAMIAVLEAIDDGPARRHARRFLARLRLDEQTAPDEVE